MLPDQRADIAVITVIPVEFHAAVKALGIDLRNRTRQDGVIYYTGTIYSNLFHRDLRIVLMCIGEASQANAGAAASRLIPLYRPALAVLLGIAAGWRGKIRIGDVVVPRDVADLSVRLQMPDGSKPRPQIRPLSAPVKNMMPGFLLDETAYHGACGELFGTAITPPAGQEAEFAQHVTFAPKVSDGMVGSQDALLRDPEAFARMSETHDQIRIADMESGGFVKACEGIHPPQPWLVVRGVSDFGDQLKNDHFHRLAATAAAAWLRAFLTDGFDLENIRPFDEPVSPAGPALGNSNTASQPATQASGNQNATLLSSLTVEAVNAQFEQLAIPLNADRERDYERLRDFWHQRRDASVLSEIRTLQQRPEMRFADARLRGKLRRLEASIALAVEKDVGKAKRLATEADAIDPSTNPEFLRALIVFHEQGKEAALRHLATPQTLESWNLRVSLLIQCGQQERATEELEHPPTDITPDAESFRLLASAALESGQLAKARTEIRRASALRPQWFLIRYTEAVIDYFESFSAPLFAHTRKDWPLPTDTALLKRDRATLDSLHRAEQIFSELLSAQNLDVDMRQILEGWRLACLANDVERQAEAQAYCAELLERAPAHPCALPWAAARGFAIDLTHGTDALMAELMAEGV